MQHYGQWPLSMRHINIITYPMLKDYVPPTIFRAVPFHAIDCAISMSGVVRYTFSIHTYKLVRNFHVGNRVYVEEFLLDLVSLRSSEVPLVLNLQTGSITPQYHVVFDDHFSTVTSVEREMDPPHHWAELCLENATYIPTDPTDVGANGDSTTMFLDDDWLTPEELDAKIRSGHLQTTIRDTFEPEAAPTLPPASAPTATISLPTSDDAPDLIAEPPIVHARVTQREQRAVQREQREQLLLKGSNLPLHSPPLHLLQESRYHRALRHFHRCRVLLEFDDLRALQKASLRTLDTSTRYT